MTDTPDHTHPLMAERLRKRSEWVQMGFNYPEQFVRTHTAGQLVLHIEQNAPRTTKEVMNNCSDSVAFVGRIVQQRDMGKLVFLSVLAPSGAFQVCLAEKVLHNALQDWKKLLDLGDLVGFRGEVFHTKHGEPTLMACEVIPLAKAIRPLPEKFHGLTDKETQYRQRYLDLISNEETRERFRVRSAVTKGIRAFLDERAFLEVETPIIQHQAGGAMAQVFRTHHNAFDDEFVLRISLELELKMLTVGGLERVYEIGKCFRNEGVDPSHMQEFTLLEWYASYHNLEDNKNWTEEMLREVIQKALCKTSVTILDKDNTEHIVDFAQPWKCVAFAELLKTHAGVDIFEDDEKVIHKCALSLGMPPTDLAKTGHGNILDFIYKKTARPLLIQPTFVFDYPSDLKPLARPKAGGVADCFQLVIAGWEVVNSYGELVDPTVQRQLLESQAAAKEAGDDEAMAVDERFLTAMEHGMPPMTGSGIGIDRLVALITGQPNIRDVVLFPLMKPKK